MTLTTLERLQRILFYRELGFSLDHIAAALASIPLSGQVHLALGAIPLKGFAASVHAYQV